MGIKLRCPRGPGDPRDPKNPWDSGDPGGLKGTQVYIINQKITSFLLFVYFSMLALKIKKPSRSNGIKIQKLIGH